MGVSPHHLIANTADLENSLMGKLEYLSLGIISPLAASASLYLLLWGLVIRPGVHLLIWMHLTSGSLLTHHLPHHMGWHVSWTREHSIRRRLSLLPTHLLGSTLGLVVVGLSLLIGLVLLVYRLV